MFDHQQYVPILKWRQGEYLALERSDNSIKDWITPLFELPLEPWDFEEKKAKKTLEEHLEKFGSRLKKKWGSRRCFVDSPFQPGTAKVNGSTHHMVEIFSLARSEGASPVPVTGLQRVKQYQKAVADIMKVDKRGFCLRLTPKDFDTQTPSIASRIGELLKELNTSPASADLIIDSADDIAGTGSAQANTWSSMLGSIPNLLEWRTLTVAGGSFPSSLAPASSFRPFADVKRREWISYRKLVALKPKRIPAFGDYSASAPHTELIDPRLLDPNAKIKYAIDDHWRVVMGKQVKRHGREQYQDLCVALISSKPTAYAGRTYSWGDGFIRDCADGKGNGGSSTWPTVATNHQAAKVVRDLANLFGSSKKP